MKVRNVHERPLDATPADVGALIDDPGRMWPSDRWPRMTPGGIGFLRHELLEHRPGERVTYRITGPRGFSGQHGWAVERHPGERVALRHTVDADCRGLMMLGWPLVVRPMHDALHEDILDGAEAAVGGEPAKRTWSRRVRVLRRGLRRLS